VLVYEDAVLVPSLPAFDTVTAVLSEEWTPGGGLWQGYRVTAYTLLTGDQVPRNDTARMNLMVSTDTLFSFRTSHGPVIDGYLDAGEWSQAHRFDASNIVGWLSGSSSAGSALGYFMHDDIWMYMAFELPPAATRDTFDLVALYCDENNNGQWETSLSEGNYDVRINDSLYDEVLYRPWTPAGPGQPAPAIGAVSSTGTFNGHLVFEARIPLGTLPYRLNLNPAGDTCGIWLHAVHSDVSYGWWRSELPADSFGVPAGYGKLILRTLQSGDVGVTSIEAPTGCVPPGGTVTPRATWRNYESTPMSFTAYCFIADPSGTRIYSRSQTSQLNGGQQVQLTFPESGVLTVEGGYVVKCSTAAAGDQNPTNDWRQGAFAVGLAADFGVAAILVPAGNQNPDDTVEPAARIRCNYAQSPHTVRTWFFIAKPGGARFYADSIDVANMTQGAETVLVYRPLVLDSTAGLWTTKCSLHVLPDTFLANNFLSGSFRVGVQAPAFGWHEVSPSVPGSPAKDGAWLAGNMTCGVYCAKGNKTGEFYRFDPAGTGWTTLNQVPPGREGKPPYKGAVGAADNRGHVYVLKGNNTLGFHKYFAARNAWFQLDDVPLGGGKKVKGGSDLVYVQHGDSDCVYLLKGVSNEFYRYVVTGESSGSWQPMAPVTGEKWQAGSWLCYDGSGRIYAQQARTHAFQYYSTSSGSWQSVANTMPFVSRHTGRSKKSKDGGSAAWCGGSIYALKGGNTQEFYKFTPATGLWTELDTVPLFGSTGKKVKVKAGGDIVNYMDWFYALKGAKTNEFWTYREPVMMPAPQIGRSGVAASTAARDESGVLCVLPSPLRAGLVSLPVSGRAAEWSGGRVTVSVLDVSGRVLRSDFCSLQSPVVLDLRGLRPGVYLLRLEQVGRCQTCKFTVQR
jgi:hypothetical protein